MPLSADLGSRTRKHTRSVRLEAYALADGLFDIEAHLADVMYVYHPRWRDRTKTGTV